MSRDIIIHYDAAEGKIVCCTVDAASTAALRSGALPLETPIDLLKAKDADEAERSLGAGILALLDISNDPKIGIRDYEADKEAATTQWEAENTRDLEQRSAAGDSQALFDLAVEKAAKGLRTKSKKLMNEADDLLRKSVAAGHAEATKYLSDLWPALKSRSDTGFK